MPLYGYHLSGNTKSAAADYIPSLIGVLAAQVHPAETDTYFERIDLPEEALALTSIAFTRWVSYDSLPLSDRDPILAVKGGGIGFYIPLSELEALLLEAGDADLITMLERVKKGRL